jgi:hypothetical protein
VIAMNPSSHWSTPCPRARAVRPGAAAVALALLALVAFSPVARATDETEVRVERVRPQTEKHPTLRFLRENIDFIRAALDRTRQKAISRDADAERIDPRFLAYQELIARVMTDHDSVAVAQETQRRRDLLRSVTELGDLESQLDQFDRLLVTQRDRLAILQHDFTGDQRTALAVVLSGLPATVPLTQVALTLDDGSVLSVPLTAVQRDALRQGGAVQIFHGFVEPREQVVQVSLAADGGSAGDAGFITLDPARDRLTLLRLDLSALHAGGGAPDIHATTWLNDAQVP